jgi:hypothetical protein
MDRLRTTQQKQSDTQQTDLNKTKLNQKNKEQAL